MRGGLAVRLFATHRVRLPRRILRRLFVVLIGDLQVVLRCDAALLPIHSHTP